MQLKFSNPDRARIGYQLAVLSFITLRNAVGLLGDLRDMRARFMLRGAFVFLSGLLTTPLRVIERVVYGRAVGAMQLDPAPIFIVGHWRSGTTHLHNLMAQDSSLGFVSMYQSILPESSLVAEKMLKPLFSWLVPLARPMDDMVWPLDSPQEEEIPFSKTHHNGFYARLLFPRKLVESFDERVLLRGASARAVRTWKRQYLKVLRKAAYRSDGRRLVLKNPVNTGRIALLLEMFPDAKFIFVHRHPYEVFLSTCRLHDNLLDIVALGDSDRSVIESNVLEIYERVMRHYLAERKEIPRDNLVEVAFDDLARSPAAEMKRIYETLDLPGFESAAPSIAMYVASQAGYRPAEYEFDQATTERVDRAWDFAFEELGYGDGAVSARRCRNAS